MTFINNKNQYYDISNIYSSDVKIYKGGGIIMMSDQVYVFYEDFLFDKTEYKDAKFESNEDGYKGYIFNEKNMSKYNKDDFLDNINPDVTIKFYIEDIESVPTGIEPVT